MLGIATLADCQPWLTPAFPLQRRHGDWTAPLVRFRFRLPFEIAGVCSCACWEKLELELAVTDATP